MDFIVAFVLTFTRHTSIKRRKSVSQPLSSHQSHSPKGNSSPETIKYLAAKFGVAESVILDMVKAGMPAESVAAATNWLKTKDVSNSQELLDSRQNPQDESLLSSYHGEQNSSGQLNGWGR